MKTQEGFPEIALQACPCGHYGDPLKECRCSFQQIQRYRSRLSGPLLDRIDIHIEVPAVKYKELAEEEQGEGSLEIRQRVQRARKVQQERFLGEGIYCNAQMRTSH
ncbi:MAG TPA: ATP-binding protein, partial [Deltaproteobacteria bacterium]|nr:ATP-binding protein [Deltaproteobacteria bacterium]